MARASFTLRKLVEEGGSYLQYPNTTGTAASVVYPPRADSDNTLKSDDLQIAPILDLVIPGGNSYYAAAYFTADAVDYNQVDLSWGIPLSQTVGPLPVPTEALLVYSPNGEPETLNDGAILVQVSQTAVSTYSHTVISGKWAYYTVFIKYESSEGDLFFEPAAKLSVLVPTNYGTVNDLYDRIPLYYRELDCACAQESEGTEGPLRRYLSIIGWDIDRLRTLIDYLMVCKDPQNARSQELDLIAQDLGVNLRSEDVGPFRLRSLLNDIGILRRTNGTLFGLLSSIVTLTGSFVSYDKSTNKIYIQPQRVNYCKDPSFKLGIAGGINGGSPFSETSTTINGGVWNEVFGPDPDVLSGGAPDSNYSGGATGNELWQSFTTGEPNTSVFSMASAYLRVRAGDIYYFSAQSVGLNLTLQEAITKVTLYTPNGGSGGSVPAVGVVATTNAQLEIGNKYYWRLDVPDSYTSFTPAYLEIEFNNTKASVDNFTLLLLEKNNVGDYFDGNTVEGGWIVDEGGSISDFQWLNPESPGTSIPNVDFSVFNSNFQKTRSVINRLQQDVLPLTELGTTGMFYSNRPTISSIYEVIYNYLPGYTVLQAPAGDDSSDPPSPEDLNLITFG
jgi:hypothetical protein